MKAVWLQLRVRAESEVKEERLKLTAYIVI